MKNLLLSVVFFCNFFLIAQEPPNVFPVSPEAATLGQFGEIPVNASIGTSAYSIPIYTVEDGDFSLPISLNYFYSGLVVDKIPGDLGLGWSLNAGGMITRQVRGRPDDDPNGYIGAGMVGLNWVLKLYNNELTASEKGQLNQGAANGSLDTQPDKFMINVGGLSASFYFDENRDVVVKPYKPIKVNVINGDFSLDQGFEIIDDQGTIYTFQAKEYSERIAPIYTGDITSTTGPYVSGWKLTKIKTTQNRTIDLTYSDYIYKQKITYQSVDIKLPSTVQPQHTTHANYQISSKVLNSISFSLGQVTINSTQQAITDFNQYYSRIDGIQIHNNHNQEIQSFQFTYDFPNKTRKLLKEVKLNNDPSYSYNFDYDGIPSENIPFYKQDFWGYYNANSNVGKLIEVDDLYYPREANFQTAKTASLTKITYPTGGTTEFTYEANTYDPGINGDEYDDYYSGQSTPCDITTESHAVSATIFHPSSEHDKIDEKQFTITSDTPANIYMEVIKGSLTGTVEATLEEINGAPIIGCSSSSVLPCHPSTTCNKVYLQFSGGFTLPGDVHTETFSKKVYLSPGTYKLSVELTNVFVDSEHLYSSASASVNLNTTGQLPPQARSRETGGIRIASVKSCPDSNPNNCITREFSYETDAGISNGHLFRRRNLYKSYYTVITGDASSGYNQDAYERHSSSSNAPLAAYMGSHIIYKEVTEKMVGSGSENNGSKKSVYNFTTPPILVMPFLEQDIKPFKNGKVLEEHLLNDQDVEVKTTFYEYDFSEDLSLNQRILSFKSMTNHYNDTGSGPYGYITDLAVFSNNYDVDRVARVRDFSTLGSGSVEIDTHNYFTNPEGHLKQKDITNSDGLLNKILYSYPYNINEPGYTDLVTKNRLSIQVSSTTYEENEPLTNQKTIFKLWGTDIIEPELIQSSKYTHPLENRVNFLDYDNNGNSLEVSRPDGSHTAQIWGYNQQYPIAKIENATYSEVESFVLNIQSLSNADNDRTRNGIGNEGALRVSLNNLRDQLPNSYITTYTYDPLIGVTSITDPSGYTVYYEYDNFNRLKAVRDDQGKLLSENEYNYYSQNQQ